MRTVILVIGLLMGAFAHAGFRAETSTSNLGLLNVIQCSTGTSCSKSGGKLVVTTTGAGVLQSQVASTTTSLTSAQCGSTIVSNSADVVTLPEASTVLGCRYTFVCGTADDFDINPADGTDDFGPINVVGGGTASALAPAAGDAIRCTDIGSSITIEAVGADLWSAIGVANGPFTDVD